MKDVIIKIIKYLRHSILNKSLKMSIRLICSPIYYIIYIIYYCYTILTSNKYNDVVINSNISTNNKNVNYIYYFQKKNECF